MRIDRTSTLNLFYSHASTLDIRDIEPTGPYSCLCAMNGRRYQVLVLVRSSDYWQKRVHLSAAQPTLLVVWEHDSFVPLSVLSLKTGDVSPSQSNARYTSEKRNRYTAKAYLGKLLCGMQSAYDGLESMPKSVKYRYLAEVHRLMRRGRGRPLAV